MNTATFEKLKNVNVLICGDVMLDRYLLGRVDRISPEAPVPIVQHQQTENRLGGAANVALNVRALGSNAFTCGIIGNDENGDIFQNEMRSNNLNVDYIVRSAHRRTTTKTRVIANKHHLLRVDQEDLHALESAETANLLDNVQKCMDEESIQVVILQDYNKGVMTKEVIDKVIQLASERGIFVAVDPKKQHFFDYVGVDLFKPNLKEVSEALNMSINPSEEDMKRATNALNQQLHHKNTLITLSEHGLWIASERSSHLIPTRKRNIVDVCGAGDTVLSIASIALSQGIDFETTGILANTAGGQVCERVGVVPIDLDQLIDELS